MGHQLNNIAPVRIGPRQWLLRFPRAVPIVIFLLTLFVIGISVYAIEKSEAQRENAQLHQTAMAVATALERRADAHAAYLRAGSALLSHQKNINGKIFLNFVNELNLKNDYRGAEGVGWAPIVRVAELPAFERQIADEYGHPFSVRPPHGPGQDHVIPLLYVEPANALNRGGVGFNMLSDPGNRKAMVAAAADGRPVATDKLLLVQGSQQQPEGFVIFMPVFQPGANSGAVRGFITSAFNAQNFLASALHKEPLGTYGIRLYDRSVTPANLMAVANNPDQSGMAVVRPMTIAAHPWVLQVRASKRDMLSPLSVLTLISGLLIASLLMVVVRLMTRQAVEDRETLNWLGQQNSIRVSLTRELNHRVKNTLANVLSLIALTRRRASDLDSFVEGLDGRIRALSATHDLLTQSDWGATPIRSVIETELAPYAKAGEHLLFLSGPDVELAPNDALSLGLAVHELATNAAKYGALSTPGGKIVIAWYLMSDTLIRMKWSEEGGPPVSQDRIRGFGMDLIEKVVAHELGSPIDLRFETQGVECTLIVPVREAGEFSLRARHSAEQ